MSLRHWDRFVVTGHVHLNQSLLNVMYGLSHNWRLRKPNFIQIDRDFVPPSTGAVECASLLIFANHISTFVFGLLIQWKMFLQPILSYIHFSKNSYLVGPKVYEQIHENLHLIWKKRFGHNLKWQENLFTCEGCGFSGEICLNPQILLSYGPKRESAIQNEINK